MICEGHASLFAKLLEDAQEDIRNAPLDSDNFKTAVYWMLFGWGYDLVSALSENPEKFRRSWIDVILRRIS
jgi:phage FluMu gp28-like protein